MSDERPTPAPPDADTLTQEENTALQGVLDSEQAKAGSDGQLWVFTFDGPLRAQEALLAALRLVGRNHLELDDAAIVTKLGKRVRINQTKDVNPGQGALSGTLWGTLAGLVVFQPLIGAAVGAAFGGLFGKLRDIGINDDQMRQMGESLADGEAALFLLVTDCHQVRALHEVARFEAKLLFTSASDELADRVRERLAVDPWTRA